MIIVKKYIYKIQDLTLLCYIILNLNFIFLIKYNYNT